MLRPHDSTLLAVLLPALLLLLLGLVHLLTFLLS